MQQHKHTVGDAKHITPLTTNSMTSWMYVANTAVNEVPSTYYYSTVISSVNEFSSCRHKYVNNKPKAPEQKLQLEPTLTMLKMVII